MQFLQPSAFTGEEVEAKAGPHTEIAFFWKILASLKIFITERKNRILDLEITPSQYPLVSSGWVWESSVWQFWLITRSRRLSNGQQKTGIIWTMGFSLTQVWISSKIIHKVSGKLNPCSQGPKQTYRVSYPNPGEMERKVKSRVCALSPSHIPTWRPLKSWTAHSRKVAFALRTKVTAPLGLIRKQNVSEPKEPSGTKRSRCPTPSLELLPWGQSRQKTHFLECQKSGPRHTKIGQKTP